MLANSLRGELGTFTGPVSTSGSPMSLRSARSQCQRAPVPLHAPFSLPLQWRCWKQLLLQGALCGIRGTPASHPAPMFQAQGGSAGGTVQPVQHWLNPEMRSERRAKCWPGVFTSFVLKVCSFSHFNPARQVATPKDGCANSSCLLYGGTGISTARATKLPQSPTGKGQETEATSQKWWFCHPTNLKSDLKP